MDAIIYAAGRATRLGPAYADRAKILIDIGGKSLLEWHVRHLIRCGVARIFVVTGHMRELVAVELASLAVKHQIPIQEMFNADFCEGSVLSLNVSLPVIESSKETILLMDGDVFYDQSFLERLLRSVHRTALLIDAGYSTADDDPVLVPIRDGKPFEFLKCWKGKADLVGESVGFFKIHPAEIPSLVQEARSRTAGPGRLESYDEAIRTLVKAGCFGYEDVTGQSWTEIDFPQDVEYALNVVYPACAALTRTTTP
jgi:choline kinase